MDRLRSLFLPLLILGVSLFLISQLFTSTHYLGGLRLPLSSAQIEQRSARVAGDLGLDVRQATATTSMVLDRSLIRQVQQSYGIRTGNELLSTGVPGFLWEVRWESRDLATVMAQAESGAEEDDAARAMESLQGTLRMRLDAWGRIVEISQKVEDSVRMPPVDSVQALDHARRLLREFTTPEVGAPSERAIDLRLESGHRIETQARQEYVFVWQGRSALLPDTVHVEMRLAGNSLLSYSASYLVPPEFSDWAMEPVRMTSTILGYVLAIILMLVVAIKRLKADEIGFRLAGQIGVVGVLATMLSLYLTMPGEVLWQMILSLVLAPLLIGGGLLLSWAVGESITREVWKEKLIAFDLLSRGHVLHSRVGRSLVEGVAWGSAALVVALVMQALLQQVMPISFTLNADDLREILPSGASPVAVLTSAFFRKSFTFTLFVLFGLSWLRGRTGVVAAAAIVAVGGALLSPASLLPYSAAVLVEVAVLAVIVLIFARGDALSSLVALLTFAVAPTTLAFLKAGNAEASQSALILFLVAGGLVLLGIAVQFRRKEIVDFESMVPAFGRHISERQRLQHELEIARRVQMSFLPRESPRVGGIDLASRCLPAQEVGGDYYDFLYGGGEQVGIVVGDVSGKGTQAAFYMTLAKGFLKALTERVGRPLTVVQEMNKLFYANVERGAFISLIYGVLDLSTKTLTVARAGHNPLLIKRADASVTETVNSGGLALGLERGDVFARAMEEVTIPLHPGDVVVFYTDGFSEAVNRQGEEFGLERLRQAIEGLSHLPAQGILDGAFDAVKAYIGKAPQRDDMTMVVVKVEG